MSTIAVAERLNALGIPSPKSNGREKESVSGRWNCDRIRNIVINTVYMGTYVYGKSKSRNDNTREKVSISVPPIVDEELWYKAQETLKRNRRFASRNSKHEYLLRGSIRCNFCGHSYVGQARINEDRHYYRCLRRMGYWKKIYDECPGKGKTVRRDWIEGCSVG